MSTFPQVRSRAGTRLSMQRVAVGFYPFSQALRSPSLIPWAVAQQGCRQALRWQQVATRPPLTLTPRRKRKTSLAPCVLGTTLRMGTGNEPKFWDSVEGGGAPVLGSTGHPCLYSPIPGRLVG